MPPQLSESEAGPSKKRIATFKSTSDGESSGYEEEEPIIKRKKSKLNGNGTRGVKGQEFGTPNANGVRGDEKRRKLKERAGELLEMRQELPFYQGRRAILDEIMANETTIILGETGCGKSTQLPQLLRNHPLSTSNYSSSSSSSSGARGKGPMIAITQPRRLPCIALARRVSEEMGCECGDEVGYSVRFEEAMSQRTGVRYLTEGVMMRELANGSKHESKPAGLSNGHTNGHSNGHSSSNGHVAVNGDDESESDLNLLVKYDIIIIDEAHERTLNTDFLCGALKKIQRLRRELHKRKAMVGGKRVMPLKLVIMSATLDPTKFRNFFETGRDSLLVKGRMYNVSTRHVVDPVDDFIEAAANKVMAIHCTKPEVEGDVLVFMPGSEEIETCVELLKRATKDLPPEAKALQVLPLYAGLPSSAQNKIFAPLPPSTRRIVVATNIAETSITIPGVVYVIDTGYKKEKEYVHRTSGAIEQLRKRAVSKAAAWQRTGRAGRERDGECFRLFTKEAFDKLIDFDAPEIQRCNLSSAVLQLVAMNQDPFTFEYIDNPGREAIGAAFQTLAGLGALSGPRTITPLGLEMLKYPLDPPHARILIASFSLGCSSEIIDILSLINSGPLFIDRSSDRESAAQSRAKFIHRDGDHLTQLSVLRAYIDLKISDTKGVGKWLKENHVNGKTIQHALKVREQLKELARRDGKDPNMSCGSESEVVGRCLLRGLFMNTAIVQSDGSYRQTAGSLIVKIHPSSVLMSRKVPAILYDELTITSAIYARNVTVFDQHWLTEIPWFQQAGTSVPQPADKNKL